MQFSTLTISALFGALAAAVTTETVQIQDFSLRQNNSVVIEADFTLQPAGVSCVGDSTAALENTVSCGNGYSFYLKGNELSEYNVTVYKQTGDFAGIWAKTAVPVYCRAGGDGPTDYICSGEANVNVTLTPTGP